MINDPLYDFILQETSEINYSYVQLQMRLKLIKSVAPNIVKVPLNASSNKLLKEYNRLLKDYNSIK